MKGPGAAHYPLLVIEAVDKYNCQVSKVENETLRTSNSKCLQRIMIRQLRKGNDHCGVGLFMALIWKKNYI